MATVGRVPVKCGLHYQLIDLLTAERQGLHRPTRCRRSNADNALRSRPFARPVAFASNHRLPTYCKLCGAGRELPSRAIRMHRRSDHYRHRERLRDRFLRSSLDGFTHDEVVELLLTLVTSRVDTQQAVQELMSRFGDLRGILDASMDELRSVPGLGSAAPVALQVVRSIATLYLQQLAEGRNALADPEQLSNCLRLRIGGLPNEVFDACFLDARYRLRPDGILRITEGTVDRVAVYPRRLVEAALRRRACAMVLAHNHPNGVVQPTEQDKVLTRAISLAAEIVNIRVVDHLIVSVDEVFSFRKAGLL